MMEMLKRRESWGQGHGDPERLSEPRLGKTETEATESG